MYLTEQDIERFWSGVDRSGGPEACWPWNGANGRNVYRQFWLNGANVGGHVVALALDGRPVRDGFWALHHCDYKPCHNPKHLYEGTIAQNVQDSYNRGRIAGNSRYTPEQVQEAERLIEETTMSLRKLSDILGIDRGILVQIRDGTHQYSKKASGC
jgi:hypothetical protein